MSTASTSWYGVFQLDPYVIASIGFKDRISNVSTYIGTDSGTMGPLYTKATMIYRTTDSGCGTSWIFYTVFSVTKALNLKNVTFIINTIDGYTIPIVLNIYSRVATGTYMLMYATCIRSTEPLLLVLST
jgi:predicted RNase H-related nuclease YkuK (DUF458 family)